MMLNVFVKKLKAESTKMGPQKGWQGGYNGTMIIIIDIFVGILAIAGASFLLWVFGWVLKLLGRAFRYIVPHSGIAKIRGWLASQGWISELNDILLLLVILAIALFVLFGIGQIFTGKPYIG